VGGKAKPSITPPPRTRHSGHSYECPDNQPFPVKKVEKTLRIPTIYTHLRIARSAIRMVFRRFRGYARAPRARIDKKVETVNKTSSSTTQEQSILLTAAAPCMLNGMDIDLNFGPAIGSTVFWAVVFVGDGYNASTLQTADGATMYEPEQNVLASGVLHAGGSAITPGSTQHSRVKTKRKLMIGDQIIFVCKRVTAASTDVQGVITQWYKY